MSSSDRAILEGGPAELAGQIVSIQESGTELKVPFRNGYEHFKATSRQVETADGPVHVYEWWERTEMPA
jgi:hypothetical protein